ncbi:GNAT family N-acetyltransferase [uncultured Enterovirga sp.]|uniref:GNAT family N-acetyltransferase n=1 Tax=uncultured Enterovirga sp. TaxID=2026352 RepID=UPI0035CB8840
MFPDLTRDDVFRLETRRLWLRWPRQADAPAIVRLAGEKAVAEMTSHVPHPYGPEDATAFVLATRRANAEGAGLTLAITPNREPTRLIGTVRIGVLPSENRPSLGYWLGSPHWGDGLATEAARAMIDSFFAYTNGDELHASARVINGASRRVIEKCGFNATGSGLQAFPARGGVFPVDTFRLDRRTWASFKAWSSTGFVPQGRHEEWAHAH